MNNLIVKALIFVAGVITGGGTTYFVCKRKNEELLNKEAAEARAHYNRLLAENGVTTATVADFREVEDACDDGDENGTSDDVAYEKTDFTDYTKCYRSSAESEHPEDDKPEEPKKRSPRIIKVSEFGDKPGYSTVDLLYYTVDGTITIDPGEDQDEEVLSDFDEIEGMIGDSLTKYGFNSNDELVIYVRNDIRKVDYCIRKIVGSYEEL